MNKKVLLTGADGFIGSHLLEELVQQGYSVKAFATIILLILGVGLIRYQKVLSTKSKYSQVILETLMVLRQL
jgi:thioester reductase-like protein